MPLLDETIEKKDDTELFIQLTIITLDKCWNDLFLKPVFKENKHEHENITHIVLDFILESKNLKNINSVFSYDNIPPQKNRFLLNLSTLDDQIILSFLKEEDISLIKKILINKDLPSCNDLLFAVNNFLLIKELRKYFFSSESCRDKIFNYLCTRFTKKWFQDKDFGTGNIV